MLFIYTESKISYIMNIITEVQNVYYWFFDSHLCGNSRFD